MQMNLEKRIDAAVDLKIATLRAKEQGITGYTQNTDNSDSFQIYNEKDFRQMLKTREYKIEIFNYPPYKYQYSTKVAGLNFIYKATEYLFTGDESKLEREEI